MKTALTLPVKDPYIFIILVIPDDFKVFRRLLPIIQQSGTKKILFFSVNKHQFSLNILSCYQFYQNNLKRILIIFYLFIFKDVA